MIITKQAREKAEDIKQKLKSQNERYYNLFLKHNEDLIKAIDLYLKHKITGEHLKVYINANRKRAKEILNIFFNDENLIKLKGGK